MEIAFKKKGKKGRFLIDKSEMENRKQSRENVSIFLIEKREKF